MAAQSLVTAAAVFVEGVLADLFAGKIDHQRRLGSDCPPLGSGQNRRDQGGHILLRKGKNRHEQPRLPNRLRQLFGRGASGRLVEAGRQQIALAAALMTAAAGRLVEQTSAVYGDWAVGPAKVGIASLDQAEMGHLLAAGAGVTAMAVDAVPLFPVMNRVAMQTTVHRCLQRCRPTQGRQQKNQ